MAVFLDGGGKLTLSIGASHVLYIRRDKMIQTDGTVRISAAIPSPYNAVLARLMNGAYAMQCITSNAKGGRVTLTCPGGLQLIGLRLSHGERLVVSFSHVVGFSKRPRFVSFANLSVAAFACDRNFATIAEGPGVIVLETHGNHVVHQSGKVVLDPDQLIAWDPSTKFKFDKIHSLTDLYLNRLRVSCQLDSGVLPLILDSAPKKGSTATNPLVGFLRSVYWPRFH
jgi:uncharacterized protein (AIM24 family)